MLVIITVCILAVPGFISCKTVANTEAKTEETQTEAKEQLSQDSISADKFRKAAEQGDAKAQHNLGICYYFGRGVEQDYTQAVQWWSKAAEQGLADAHNNLGICYENGEGVEQDYTQAAHWYRKAAEQGDAKAQCYLGDCYYHGNGVEQDLYPSCRLVPQSSGTRIGGCAMYVRF